ncbi:hypothetical protein C8R43DRAFT_954499 [Mycena crocata]|nr:hypothetical protein C8R43DRAFT_954499 [Mycena crocata]
MAIQPNETEFGTLDPPGSREGFGEMVHPSRECLPAASSEREISRSQGTQGPIPGYHTLGPFCSGSVALAVTEPSEEQQLSASPDITFPARYLPCATMVNVELEPSSQRNIENAQYSQSKSNGNREAHDACTTSNSWEVKNLAIRRRHKPPRVLKTGKFTRSNLTVGTLNIAGRDGHLSIHNGNHKFKYFKETWNARDTF